MVSRPAQFVVSDPGGVIPAGRIGDEIVQAEVPQLDLLARAGAVICHAGHNTVCEALSFGVPLVTAPIRDDQPVIAQQVSEVGAGVRVRFGRATAAHLAAAVDIVGADRCLWSCDYVHMESNYGYGWSAKKIIVDTVSADDARAMLGGTAIKVFGL